MLILLVIWGHLIERAAFSQPVAAAVYSAIYLFHFPAFVMLGGMVARPEMSARTVRGGVRRLLWPLAVFQVAYWPFLDAFAPERVGGPVTPHWILWFLASMAVWRLLLPAFVRLGPVPSILLACTCAIIAGFDDGIGRAASLSRTFVFLPAFLAGYWIARSGPAVFGGFSAAAILPFAAPVLAVAAAGYLGWDFTRLYGSLPYAATGEATAAAAIARLAIILAGGVTAVLFLALVPGRSRLLERPGRSSLSIYLLHGFVVVFFWAVVPPDRVGHPAAFVLLAGGLAGAIGVGLLWLAEAWRSLGPTSTAG